MDCPAYIRKNETQNLSGDRVILYYYCKKSQDGDGYSVGIDMYTQIHGERTLKEEKVIDNVYPDYKRTAALVDKLCRGCVTPMSLKDVLYDTLSAV